MLLFSIGDVIMVCVIISAQRSYSCMLMDNYRYKSKKKKNRSYYPQVIYYALKYVFSFVYVPQLKIYRLLHLRTQLIITVFSICSDKITALRESIIHYIRMNAIFV